MDKVAMSLLIESAKLIDYVPRPNKGKFLCGPVTVW
jgi:hypothetical protein